MLIFLRTNVVFCTKASLISYGGSNSSQGGALRSFSPGAVATIAVTWKSASMVASATGIGLIFSRINILPLTTLSANYEVHVYMAITRTNCPLLVDRIITPTRAEIDGHDRSHYTDAVDKNAVNRSVVRIQE